MRTLSALPRSASVMVLEDGQKALLVADVQQTALVKVVKSIHESVWAAHRGNETCHVVGNKE